MARLRTAPLGLFDALGSRAGVSRTGVTVALVAASALLAVAWLFWPSVSGRSASNQPILHTVARGTFRRIVTEAGEVESSSNVEVRCEVQSRSAGTGTGTIILEVVPEGTWVEKGEELIRLDSSALEDEKVLQEITVSTAYAAVVQTESAVETAEIAKQEYLEGTFRQEEQLILAETSVAEENVRRAKDYLRYSNDLFTRGFQSELQLDADRFAVEKAETDLETARIKLEGLRKYTRAKMLSELNANIKVAKADLQSSKATHESERSRLKFIGDQIAKCDIRAPAAGQVVYANEQNRRGGEDTIIEAGTPVREGQVMVRLPDPNQMQVKARIDEARIDMVRASMAATIKLDAMPDLELKGTVIKVDDYPISGSWWNNVKQYAAIIEIKDTPQGLRPGLTAEVRIYTEHQSDVLQVPVQAVFEHQRRHYCIMATDPERDQFATREVTIGSTNDKFVVIAKGLDEKEIVLLNPRSFMEVVGLPKLSAIELVAQTDLTAEEIKAGLQSADTREPAGRRNAEGRRGNSRPGNSDSDPRATALTQFDTNRDGKLSREEVPETMRASFNRQDSNGDGFLDASEMASETARPPRERASDGPAAQDAVRIESESSESSGSDAGDGL